MASDLEKGSYEDRAAAIARDIVVAVAGSLDNPQVARAEVAPKYAEGLATVYSILHATVLKSLKS